MRPSKFVLLVLIATGCTRVQPPPTLLSKAPAAQIPVLERKIAGLTGEKCLGDLYSLETLKAEARELEAPYFSAKKVKGRWRHLDLERLPVPQANFLQTFGGEIGDLADPRAIDYSPCQDLPCVFNQIYGQGEELAGYVHYLWYLRMGHMLSLDNHVPRQESDIPGEFNGKKFPLSSYLFSARELYGFWRLGHLLKAPYRNIVSMRQIQRLPKGESLEEKDFDRACALSGSRGWSKFEDKCLSFGGEKDQEFFYRSVAHELGHQVDFEEGRRLHGTNYRSQEKDYLKVSGFTLKEFLDKDGNVHRSWEKKRNMKLPSVYAGESPQENFAEVMAFFRTDGDLTEEKVTLKQQRFFAKNYFGGRSFDKSSLIKAWVRELGPEIRKAGLRASLDCGKNESCLERMFDGAERELRARQRLAEAEGCLVLNDNDKTRLREWKEELRPSFMHPSQGLSPSLLKSDEARAAYVECFGSNDEKRCYEEKIDDLNYLSFHPFEGVKREATGFYATLLSSREEDLRLEAEGLWKGCRETRHSDEEVPSGSLFQVNGYMVSSFHNCLNSRLPETLKRVVRGTGVRNGKEELILYEKVRPRLDVQLKSIYERELQLEAKSRPLHPLFHLKRDWRN